MPAPATPRDERGAAVVEFTLVCVLLVTLFLVVLQLGLVLHARNVMISAAQEGARFAANADRTADDGVERTREAIRGSLGSETAAALRVSPLPLSTTPGGAPVVGIEVSGPLPWVLRLVDPVRITVRGHALEEQR